MKNKLTDRGYWQNYYNITYSKKEQIETICGVYDDLWDTFIRHKDSGNQKKIIEVGAFPGRYISYIAKKYGLIPTALDYNKNIKLIKNSFNEMRVKEYSLIKENFLKLRTNKKYRYVYPIGFIEHFIDFRKIMNNHLKLLDDKCRLLIMIPNKRGLKRLYGYLCDYENLKKHNLKSMNKNVFDSFAKENNLKIILNEYIGVFQYSVHQKINLPQRLLYIIIRFFALIFDDYIQKYPHWLYSASIIAIFEKKD